MSLPTGEPFSSWFQCPTAEHPQLRGRKVDEWCPESSLSVHRLSLGVSVNLTEWNSELLGDVRSRGRQGQRLYLYVDRDLLAKLSGMPPQAAVDDFSRAFRASMGSEPFRRGARAALTWR